MKYICIYSRTPVPGKTKSRLAKVIGPESAADLAGAMLSDLCGVVSTLGSLVHQIWYPPECDPTIFDRFLPCGFTLHKQKGKDLGERMCDTFGQLLQSNPGDQAVIIGSDCVTFSRTSLEAAFSALDTSDIVIQPSEDGGYVLIGQSLWCPEIFSDIPWGNESVFGRSMTRIKNAGISCRKLPLSFDVDTVTDVARIRQLVVEKDYPRTSAWLRNNSIK
jgi:uncharacterized protein